jgi:hypothetical protein
MRKRGAASRVGAEAIEHLQTTCYDRDLNLRVRVGLYAQEE